MYASCVLGTQPKKTRQSLVGHVKTIEKYFHCVLLNNGNNMLIDLGFDDFFKIVFE